MKKCLILLLLMFPVIAGFGQNSRSVDNCNYGLQLSPFGVYGYNERLLADQVALRIELGMEANIGTVIGSNKMQAYLIHNLSLEPRYYYNLKNRAKAHKNTFGNSAEFLTMRIRLRPGYIISSTPGVYGVPDLSFIPTWGFRRVFQEKVVVELGGGVGFRCYLDDIKERVGEDGIRHLVFNLHLRFGVHFGTSKD